MNNVEKIRIIKLTSILNDATKEYDKGTPIMTDKEWDDLYFELKELEEKNNFSLENSPVQKIVFSEVSELKKVKHNHLMLSLNKTKDLIEVEKFLQNYDYIAMAKMDGLTCSLRYLNGELVSAETRGNGEVGEDVLHNALIIPSIPKKIDYLDELIVDGEIICTYDNFENFKDKYKNPRNFASGSIRLLNSKECFSRKLTFIVWDIIKGFDNDYLHNRLLTAENFGFTIVPWTGDNSTLEQDVEEIKEMTRNLYPIDGVVFKIESRKISETLGHTDHHFNNAIAYKFYDETYETHLKYIEWTMGRTGILTPVAIFDPVDIDGSTVERASLHNVSIMRETLGECAYIGETLQVYKANQIIPQIAEAGPKCDYSYIVSHGGLSANDVIERCPYCEHSIVYKKSEEGVINVYCTNPQCNGQLVNRLDHFCGKKGLDIKGLSKATLEKFIEWGWVESIEDLYHISERYRSDFLLKPGFGVKSVTKILNAIEESKHTTLDAFISAIGIPLIGRATAKELINYFETYEDFRNAVNDDNYHFFDIDNFGEEMNNSIKKFDYTEADKIVKLLNFQITEKTAIKENSKIKDKTFCITGKLKIFKNRAELSEKIKSQGGKVSDSVSMKTEALINNDTTSNSSKNKTAQKLGIKIISEEDFINQYLEN